MSVCICDALRNLVPTLLKLTLLHGFFSRFLNCTNGTKSRNAPHLSCHILLLELIFMLKFPES